MEPIRIKKSLILAVTLLCLLPIGSSFARWRPIHPGDHVIDLKRLNDSVKVYAQKMQEYMNQAQKYMDMVIMNTGVIGLDRKIESTINRYSDTYLGTTYVNPKMNFKDAANNPENIAKQDAKELEVFKAKIRQESMQSDIDVLNKFQETTDNISGRMSAISEILNQKTGDPSRGGSILGETQKNNAIDIIEAKNSISKAESEGAAMAQSIHKEQTKLVDENLDRSQGTILAIPASDPYHRNEQEKAIFEENSTNLGFGSFTGGED